jgi:ubiquinone/menaquinone biosynthesis C-methylase UbiE
VGEIIIMFVEYGELCTKVYQLTKPIAASVGGDLEYYYEQIKYVKGKVLEAGVGTGRVMIPFIKKGLTVEGVDISEQMLEQCKANLSQEGLEATLYQGDLTALNLPDKYEAIIMPTGSFCLLPKVKVKEILNSFYNHLENGGSLILDLVLPSWFVQNEVVVSNYLLDDETGILFTGTAQEIDWHSQKTSYIHRYELIRKGYVEKTEVSNFVLHWYGIEEFSSLLENCGFGKIKHETGYGKDSKSSLITFFAEKCI